MICIKLKWNSSFFSILSYHKMYSGHWVHGSVEIDDFSFNRTNQPTNTYTDYHFSPNGDFFFQINEFFFSFIQGNNVAFDNENIIAHDNVFPNEFSQQNWNEKKKSANDKNVENERHKIIKLSFIELIDIFRWEFAFEFFFQCSTT